MLQKTLQDAESREAEHQKREAVLQEQIDYLTKKLFGASSERRHGEKICPQCGTPLEYIGKELIRREIEYIPAKVELSRTTLANWKIYCSNNYFDPLYQFFHRNLLERHFLMADETPAQVLKEPGRRAESKSYMWVYRTGEDGLPPIIMYGYSETRAGENAKNFLKGFEGYLECDGYQGYNKVQGITRCCCWAHVRRYLIDAIPKGKQYDYTNPAVQGV